jgi:hypothetical protein
MNGGKVSAEKAHPTHGLQSDREDDLLDNIERYLQLEQRILN